MIEGIGKLLHDLMEDIINNRMTKIQWEKLDEGISEPNQYVKDMVKVMNEFLEPFRGAMNNVYLIKILNKVCFIANDLFISGILKCKKISEMGILQLLCGK